jgi:hypothetical protein
VSKTYRRTTKGRKTDWIYHGWRDAKWSRRAGFFLSAEDCEDIFYSKHPHRRADRGDYLEWMTTPSIWVRDMMTVPQRAKTRALLRKVLKGEVDADEVVFPHARKPHIYYW